MYGVDPEELNVFAIKATALERVIAFDSGVMLGLMESPIIRSRLAYPDQLNLPDLRANNQKALYPKKFGMTGFIEKLKRVLKERGVEILTETQISHMQIENSRISKVSLINKTGIVKTIGVDNFLWTSGWPSIASELKVNFSDLAFQKGPEVVFLNLVFDRPVNMGRLYYFYCYDEGYGSFRVTNYNNYCPTAEFSGKYPLCIEFWPGKIGRNKNELSESECIDIALAELHKFGVIQTSHRLEFGRMENNAGEFPMPTLSNSSNLRQIRQSVYDLKLKNLFVTGLMAEEGLFFLPDVLNHAFSKLDEF